MPSSTDFLRLPSSPPTGEIEPLFLGALGTPRIELGGIPISFATRHASWALFSLGLSDEQQLSLDDVCERLWPDASEGVLARRLATMTWQMRRGLGEGAWRIERTKSLLRLRLHPADSIDLINVRTQALDVLAGKAQADASLLEALAVPVLEPWSELDWVQAERRASAELRAQILSTT
jgi:DNA-binding SARP family transcriptional activator